MSDAAVPYVEDGLRVVWATTTVFLDVTVSTGVGLRSFRFRVIGLGFRVVILGFCVDCLKVQASSVDAWIDLHAQMLTLGAVFFYTFVLIPQFFSHGTPKTLGRRTRRALILPTLIWKRPENSDLRLLYMPS